MLKVILSSFLLVIISCKNDTSQAGKIENSNQKVEIMPDEKVEPTNEQKINFSETNRKDDYWSDLKSHLNIDDDQIIKLKEINKKYKRIIIDLKNNKDWSGKANRETRKKTILAKENELRLVLDSTLYKKMKSFETERKKNKTSDK